MAAARRGAPASSEPPAHRPAHRWILRADRGIDRRRLPGSERQSGDRVENARQQGQHLAAAASETAGDDPELGLLLALQSLGTSAREDLPAETRAVEALHWGVQGLGLTYPTADAPIPSGPAPKG